MFLNEIILAQSVANIAKVDKASIMGMHERH